MKKMVATLIALSIAAAVAAPMAAEARTKKKKHYARPHASGQSARSRSRNASDFEEAIADKLPFGTSRWWRQMDTEGRGGQGRPN